MAHCIKGPGKGIANRTYQNDSISEKENLSKINKNSKSVKTEKEEIIESKKEIRKEIAKLIFPAVFSYAILGVYVFVDAVFVGNKVGELGIAAINIAFSIISFNQAIGSGIGIGSAVRYTILKAQGKDAEAQEYCGGAFRLLLIAGIVLTTLMVAIPKKLMILLGASEHISEIGSIYLKVQGFSAYVMLFCEALLAHCRNNGGSKVAMFGVILGCLSNCFLDWLFIQVFDWGMFGASLASAIGQLMTLVVIVVFLVKKRVLFINCPWSKFGRISRTIIRNGIAPFSLVYIPNIVVIIINHACLRYGGDEELSIYGIVAFLVYCAYMVIQGSADGAQPLISKSKGKKNLGNYTYSSNLVFLITILFAVFSGIFFIVQRENLVIFMGASEEIFSQCVRVLMIFTPGFLFFAISRTVAAVFYASEKNNLAYVVSFSEPIFLLIGILLICPRFGKDGIWYSEIAAQGAVALTSLILVAFSTKNMKKSFLSTEAN